MAKANSNSVRMGPMATKERRCAGANSVPVRARRGRGSREGGKLENRGRNAWNVAEAPTRG